MSHDSHLGPTRSSSALMALLEIDFEEITPTRVSGSVPADEHHHQPWGLVHGGLYQNVEA